MSEGRPKGRKIEHRFGGPWTEVKLDAIADYLAFFTGALRYKPWPEKPFELWYIDAFAGSGDRTEAREVGGIFDGTPIEIADVTLDGSARRALAVDPPFKHFVFIERSARRYSALRQLASENADRSIRIERSDGNDALCEIFTSEPWSKQPGGRGSHRGVVFLDPYGMSVRWKTLQTLAGTGAIDVWYLFNLAAVSRQLAGDLTAVDDHKQAKLDEMFGTPEWRTDLYKEKVEIDLFDTLSDVPNSSTRSASQRQIEAYTKRRLECLFPYVSEPLPLLTPGRVQLFSLFCLSANASPIAIDLVKKGVKHVLKTYG
jgi:three-Cys-motif partner protein